MPNGGTVRTRGYAGRWVGHCCTEAAARGHLVGGGNTHPERAAHHPASGSTAAHTHKHKRRHTVHVTTGYVGSTQPPALQHPSLPAGRQSQCASLPPARGPRPHQAAHIGHGHTCAATGPDGGAREETGGRRPPAQQVVPGSPPSLRLPAMPPRCSPLTDMRTPQRHRKAAAAAPGPPPSSAQLACCLSSSAAAHPHLSGGSAGPKAHSLGAPKGPNAPRPTPPLPEHCCLLPPALLTARGRCCTRSLGPPHSSYIHSTLTLTQNKRAHTPLTTGHACPTPQTLTRSRPRQPA